MEKKEVVPFWISIVLVLLIATSMAFSFSNLVKQDFGINIAMFLLGILIEMCAIYYCLLGYSKSGAVFFKLYCWLNIVITALYLFLNSMNFSFCVLDIVLFLIPLLELMLYFVFAVVPDLGKKKSITLVSILSAIVVIEMIIWMIITPDSIASCIEGIVIVPIFFIMVYAKYKDKADRGTK